MLCEFNSFRKNPSNKTAFILQSGKPIFSDIVYLLHPIYIHKRSPAFTLVSHGKHVSGLFTVGPNCYLGDHDKKTILVFLSNEGLTLDLFTLDIAPMATKNALLSGRLNDILTQARAAA